MQRKNKKNVKGRGARPGRLRIVAGKWRSRFLPVAEVDGLRPTSERIRETLFNWLSHKLEGARCLDLYAGTGALGLEALSRGAGAVDFVENSHLAAATLQESVLALGATAATVHETDARAYLESVPAARFDCVFLDPPFAADNHEELCRLLASKNWLKRGALVYLEQDIKQPLPGLPVGWELLKEKTAGNVRYSLLRAG